MLGDAQKKQLKVRSPVQIFMNSSDIFTNFVPEQLKKNSNNCEKKSHIRNSKLVKLFDEFVTKNLIRGNLRKNKQHTVVSPGVPCV